MSRPALRGLQGSLAAHRSLRRLRTRRWRIGGLSPHAWHVYRAWEEWSIPLYRWTPHENGKQILLGERSILPRYLWLSPVVAAEAERTGIVWMYRPELLNAIRRRISGVLADIAVRQFLREREC